MPIAYTTVPSPADMTFESTLQALRDHDPISFVTNLAQTYGDIVRLPFGTQDIYLLNNPDFIRDVFVNKANYFAKRKDKNTERAYLHQISEILPLFEGQLGTTYAPITIEAALHAHSYWESIHQQHDLKVDMYKEVMRITLEIVFKTLFEADVKAEARTLVDAIVTMDIGYGFDPIAALLNDLVPPATVSMTPEAEAARSYLLSFMLQLIQAHRAVLSDSSESLLSWMLKQQVNGQPIGDEQIADQALKIMFSMHEVTATTLSWAWYLLSQHPNVEAQLYAELTKVLAGRTPTFEDLRSLPYTHMVLKEVRRLYPSVWSVARFVRDDVSFGHHVVPSGSIVLFSQWVMHRDPRYFLNPDQFDPLRWTEEAQTARPEYSYFPFSAGPRQCAGREFVATKDVLVLATLVQHWQARLVPGQRLEPYPQKSFTPRYGIQMTLHHR